MFWRWGCSAARRRLMEDEEEEEEEECVCAYKMERTFLCTAIKIQQQQTTARAANEPRIIAVSVRKENTRITPAPSWPMTEARAHKLGRAAAPFLSSSSC